MFISICNTKIILPAMKQYVSRERRKLEKELLYYLRKCRFFQSRFTHKYDLDWIILYRKS